MIDNVPLVFNELSHSINFKRARVNKNRWISAGDTVNFTSFELSLEQWPLSNTYIDLVCLSRALMLYHGDHAGPCLLHHHLELNVAVDTGRVVLGLHFLTILLNFFHLLTAFLPVVG